MPLPGVTDAAMADPGAYVRGLFIFGLTALGFLAVGAIALGGIQYMIAGSIGSAQKSKDLIVGALMGVGLLLGSYLLLTTIDPGLVKLSPKTLKTIDIPAIVAEFDIDVVGKSAAQIQSIVSQGKIAGSKGVLACSISQCGSQTVDGHKLSTGATTGYLALRQKIQQACSAQGLACSAKITSSVDGQHASDCHKNGALTSGTCADFIITAPDCNDNIKNCPENKKSQYLQIAANVLAGAGAGNIKSCLNEYAVKGSAYTTGGHFHCNF